MSVFHCQLLQNGVDFGLLFGALYVGAILGVCIAVGVARFARRNP